MIRCLLVAVSTSFAVGILLGWAFTDLPLESSTSMCDGKLHHSNVVSHNGMTWISGISLNSNVGAYQQTLDLLAASDELLKAEVDLDLNHAAFVEILLGDIAELADFNSAANVYMDGLRLPAQIASSPESLEQPCARVEISLILCEDLRDIEGVTALGGGDIFTTTMVDGNGLNPRYDIPLPYSAAAQCGDHFFALSGQIGTPPRNSDIDTQSGGALLGLQGVMNNVNLAIDDGVTPVTPAHFTSVDATITYGGDLRIVGSRIAKFLYFSGDYSLSEEQATQLGDALVGNWAASPPPELPKPPPPAAHIEMRGLSAVAAVEIQAYASTAQPRNHYTADDFNLLQAGDMAWGLVIPPEYREPYYGDVINSVETQAREVMRSIRRALSKANLPVNTVKQLRVIITESEKHEAHKVTEAYEQEFGNTALPSFAITHSRNVNAGPQFTLGGVLKVTFVTSADDDGAVAVSSVE
jgi:enamine deaminase RidA (YjgF/YER057c/UK114 family)